MRLIIKFIWRAVLFLKSTAFLVVLCLTLATSTAALTIKTIALSTQLSVMGVKAAAMAVQNRKAVVTAVARTRAKEKAKARLKRLLVAVPVVGIGVVGAFEYSDYQAWADDNPDRDAGDYGCEVAAISAEVVDEVLQELPEKTRPKREFMLSLIPECEMIE